MLITSGTAYLFDVTSATKPNGDRLDFHYLTGGLTLRTITNNHGYQLRLIQPITYGGGLWQPNSVVLFNMAVDSCDPDAVSCPTFSRTWPTLTFGYTNSHVTTVTETGGEQTTYSYDSTYSRPMHVYGPGNRQIDLTYQNCGFNWPNGSCYTGGDFNPVGGFRVSTLTTGGRTWTYTWDPNLGGQGVRVTSSAGYKGYASSVSFGPSSNYIFPPRLQDAGDPR